MRCCARAREALTTPRMDRPEEPGHPASSGSSTDPAHPSPPPPEPWPHIPNEPSDYSPNHPPEPTSPTPCQYAHPGAYPGRYTRVEVARVHPPGHPSDRGLATAGPARPPGPGPPGRPGPRSATCSRIAARVRHPARTPTTARHPAETRGWRTPRRSRGSVTPSRTSFRGWRDRAVVVDDGMAARPPGGEVDSSTAHRHRPGRAAPAPTRRQPRTSDHQPPTLPRPCTPDEPLVGQAYV